MEELRRMDQDLFRKEFLSWTTLIWMTGAVLLFFGLAIANDFFPLFFVPLFVLAFCYRSARSQAEKKKFADPRFRDLSESCLDRFTRFQEVIQRGNKNLPQAIEALSNRLADVHLTVQLALRRADHIAVELRQSERGLRPWSGQSTQPIPDAQSRQLYGLADRTFSEYKRNMEAIAAGIRRTEAQSAVFMTTVDSVRMKLLGYKLVGNTASFEHDEFLRSIGEARDQIEAIDQALDELDLGMFSKQSAHTGPPPTPKDAVIQPTEASYLNSTAQEQNLNPVADPYSVDSGANEAEAESQRIHDSQNPDH